MGYWALIMVGALAHELRDPTLHLRRPSVTVLLATTAAITGIVDDVLHRAHLVHSVRPEWLFGFALLHVVVGLALLAWRRQNQTVAVFVTGLGAALLGAGLADRFDGSSLVAGWTIEAVALGWLFWNTRDLRSGMLALGFGALVLGHTIGIDALPGQLLAPAHHLAPALVALVAVAGGLVVAWWIAPAADPLGAITRRATAFAAALASLYLVAIGLVHALSDHLITNAAGIHFDPGAQFGLAILVSAAGLALVVSGGRYGRREQAITGLVLACAAPVYLSVLRDARGLDAVLWLALAAVAAAAVAWRARTVDSLVPVAWLGAAVAIHAAAVEAPLLRVISAGSVHLLRAEIGLLLAVVAIAGARILLTRRSVVAQPEGIAVLTEGQAALAQTWSMVVCLADLVLVGLGTLAVSAAAVTALTPESLRRLATDNVFAPGRDPHAMLLETVVWGIAGLLVGALALHRRALHLAWAGASLGGLAVLKTLLAGPTTGVDIAAALALIAVGWVGLVVSRDPEDHALPAEAFALPAALAGGLLAVLTLVHVPPVQLLRGTHHMITATLLVFCSTLAAFGTALVTRSARRFAGSGSAGLTRWSAIAVASSAVYAVSILIVGLLTHRPPAIEQGAQIALSITWGLLAVGALVVAALTSRRGWAVRPVRIGAFALLGLAALKVVAFDTSQLETAGRTLVFIGLGLSLLGAAWLDQRLQHAPREA